MLGGEPAGDRAPTFPRSLSGLGLPAVLTILAALVFPRLAVSNAVAAGLTFAGAAVTGLASLAVAVRAELSTRRALAVGAVGTFCVAAVALVRPDAAVGAVVANTGLVCLATVLGGGIGRHVTHPGHLFPACFVAAAADVASLLHPAGPSHAIAQSDRALTALAIGFPVPGTRFVAPSLGVGDLVFIALVLGVGVVHRISQVRLVACVVVGLAAAGGLAAWTQTTIPALVPLGASVVLGCPAARRLPPRDRHVAVVAMTLAVAVVIGVILQTLLSGAPR